MLKNRIAKLKFLAEEMKLALFLTTHITDPFTSRTIARHILVRAENFISHARGLRRPLKDEGYDETEFNRLKEAYAKNFDEYFKVARDKLSAHVQDFDFGKRIELWNDIEIIKIQYFVDGAREIYDYLATLNVPGYQPYIEPQELSDRTIVEILQRFQRSLENRNWLEMGSDALAATRNNTISGVNTTLVHQRAGQLALIRRWIDLQLSLLHLLQNYPRIVRIIKARVVTDYVSFCDCLITRPCPPDAPQAMDGLDKLVVASGESAAPIEAFLAAANYESELISARSVRNKIGGHLEIAESHTIDELINLLDNFILKDALEFYQLVLAAFVKTCFGVMFLRLYMADGQRVYGASASRNAAVSYTNDAIWLEAAAPQQPPLNDVDAYKTNLTRWLDGDTNQKGDARQFFWQAFHGSEEIESISETEELGAGQRFHTHTFRKAHYFILETLNSGLSDDDFVSVLELLLTCRSGWPFPLAELLVRHGSNASSFRQWHICRVLGDIGSEPHSSVEAFLRAMIQSPSWPIRLCAMRSLFKRYVQSEGTFRINHREQIRIDFDAYVRGISCKMSDVELLIWKMTMASIMSGPGIGAFSQPFANNYSSLQSDIASRSFPYLAEEGRDGKQETLRQLIQTHDYVGICVLVALDQGKAEKRSIGERLLESCCDGYILKAAHDQAGRHLAMCFYLKDDQKTAFDIATDLAGRNPDWIAVQILTAQILGATRGAEAEAMQRISTIRRHYKLDTEHDARLAAVEAEIAKRHR